MGLYLLIFSPCASDVSDLVRNPDGECCHFIAFRCHNVWFVLLLFAVVTGFATAVQHDIRRHSDMVATRAANGNSSSINNCVWLNYTRGGGHYSGPPMVTDGAGPQRITHGARRYFGSQIHVGALRS